MLAANAGLRKINSAEISRQCTVPHLQDKYAKSTAGRRLSPRRAKLKTGIP
jgi:hypothetical protein